VKPPPIETEAATHELCAKKSAASSPKKKRRNKKRKEKEERGRKRERERERQHDVTYKAKRSILTWWKKAASKNLRKGRRKKSCGVSCCQKVARH